MPSSLRDNYILSYYSPCVNEVNIKFFKTLSAYVKCNFNRLFHETVRYKWLVFFAWQHFPQNKKPINNKKKTTISTKLSTIFVTGKIALFLWHWCHNEHFCYPFYVKSFRFFAIRGQWWSVYATALNARLLFADVYFKWLFFE